jgi:hypothetical protein
MKYLKLKAWLFRLDICSTDEDVLYKLVPKWCFDVDIDRTVDPRKWTTKNKMGEGAKTVVLSLMTKWSKWEGGG